MIRRQMTFPVEPDRLWTELTEPEAASEWMGARVDWTLVPGGPARFEEDGGRRWSGRVHEVEPNQRLRFRWWPDDGDGSPSEVTYELTPDGDGTQLTVTERPLAEIASASLAAANAVPGSGRQHAAAPEPGPQAWGAWDTRLLGVWARADALARVRA